MDNNNNNNNSLYGIIKQKTIIMKYSILLLSLLSLVCCNTDELTMIQEDPIQNQEISTELESRSMCSLDWTIDYHNLDGDACSNILVQVNGLFGNCDGCEIGSYEIELDPDDRFEDVGGVIIEYFRPFAADLYEFEQVFVNGTFANTYQTKVSNFYGIALGLGEITDFEIHTGAAIEVPICINVYLVCDGEEGPTEKFCDTVNIVCW